MNALKIEQINEKINSLAGIHKMSIIMTISLVIHVCAKYEKLAGKMQALEKVTSNTMQIL